MSLYFILFIYFQLTYGNTPLKYRIWLLWLFLLGLLCLSKFRSPDQVEKIIFAYAWFSFPFQTNSREFAGEALPHSLQVTLCHLFYSEMPGFCFHFQLTWIKLTTIVPQILFTPFTPVYVNHLANKALVFLHLPMLSLMLPLNFPNTVSDCSNVAEDTAVICAIIIHHTEACWVIFEVLSRFLKSQSCSIQLLA